MGVRQRLKRANSVFFPTHMPLTILRLFFWTFLGFWVAGCGKPATQYVGSATCGSCHSDAFQSWQASDHKKAMEVPSSETVLASFAGEEFNHFGDRYRFIKKDSSFVVITGDTAAKSDSFVVAYTFGHYPLQQYLLPTHKGRLQALTVAWDTNKEEWFSLYPDEATPEGDVLHWKSSNLNWNYMCADCHSTGLKRGFDVATDTYNTTWEEVTVGCEACHGPGSNHLSWAERASSSEKDPYLTSAKTKVVPGVGRTSTAELKVELNTCARCHSRRIALTEDFDHTKDYLDQYGPSLLQDSLYYDDGQIKDEVYVYGSFMQSKMAQKGVVCSDCHDPHTAKLRLEGNALCVTCHAGTTYDTQTHTGHETITDCVTCHMPTTTYMGVDPRRDHRFGIPNPEISALVGSPDVCASCHEGKGATWATNQIGVLRASTSANLPLVGQGPLQAHPSELLPRAVDALKKASPDALQKVERALGSPEISSIQKGSLLARLGSSPDAEALRFVLTGLKAEDPTERVGALRALSGWAGRLPAPDLSTLLRDPVKWVRLEAVSATLAYGATNWNEDGLSEVLQEYIRSQQAVADRPESHVNLGRMYESLSKYDEAERAFGVAVALDSMGAGWWLEKAMFLGRKAQRQPSAEARADAERAFGKAASFPDPLRSDVLYMMGLFLAEDAVRLPDAALVLKEASKLAPSNARMAYNAGLAHQKLGLKAEAEGLLTKASKLGLVEADDALVIFYIQNARWPEAMKLNESLISRFPSRTDLVDRKQFIAASSAAKN